MFAVALVVVMVALVAGTARPQDAGGADHPHGVLGRGGDAGHGSGGEGIEGSPVIQNMNVREASAWWCRPGQAKHRCGCSGSMPA